MSRWKNLGTTAPAELKGTRLETHHALQLVAIGVGRSLLPAAADDSHTALTWDAEGELWWGGDLGKANRAAAGLRAGLRPADLMLRVDDQGLPLAGKTLQEGLEWLRRTLAQRGLDGQRVSLDSHYEIPSHPVGGGASFGAPGKAAAELAAYYNNAHGLLAALAQSRGGEAPILTWPHHFDHAILLQSGQRGEESCSIGVGLSPGDGSYDQPYFYVTPWPKPASDDLPPLPYGHWRREGFFGAILTATELLEGDGAGQEQRARAYLEAALAAGDEMLADCRPEGAG